MSERENTLNEVQELQLDFITSVRDAVEIQFSNKRSDTKTNATLTRLFGYFSGRSQCVSFLVSHNFELDAEIVLRCFYEAFAKIAFICYTPIESRDALVEEFWDELRTANNHRTRNKAKTAEGLATSLGRSDDANVFRALQSKELYSFGNSNRKARKTIEGKWSFSEIIRYLDTGVVKSAPPNGFKSLAHMYGMQSHLVHCDDVALGLIADDLARAPDERLKKSKAHICRMWSDQACLWLFALTALRHHFGEPLEVNDGIWEEWKHLVDKMEPFSKDFFETQTDFYNRYS